MDDTHFTRATTARGQALAALPAARVAGILRRLLRRGVADRGVERA